MAVKFHHHKAFNAHSKSFKKRNKTISTKKPHVGKEIVDLNKIAAAAAAANSEAAAAAVASKCVKLMNLNGDLNDLQFKPNNEKRHSSQSKVNPRASIVDESINDENSSFPYNAYSDHKHYLSLKNNDLDDNDDSDGDDDDDDDDDNDDNDDNDDDHKGDCDVRQIDVDNDSDDSDFFDDSEFLNELEIHSKDLENLKIQDSEFYEFLLANDKELLEFGKDKKSRDSRSGESAGESDGAAGETEKAQEEKGEPELCSTTTAETSSSALLTKERFRLMVEVATTKKNFSGLRILLAAYKAAVGCVVMEESKSESNAAAAVEGKSKDQELTGKQNKKNKDWRKKGDKVSLHKHILTLSNPDDSDDLILAFGESFKLFKEIVFTVLEKIDSLFLHHICKAKEIRSFSTSDNQHCEKNNSKRKIEELLRFPKPKDLMLLRYKLLVESFWSQTTLLLKCLHNCVDEKSIWEIKKIVLQKIVSSDLLRWFVYLSNRTKQSFMNSVVDIWLECGAVGTFDLSTASEDYSTSAFLVLQALMGLIGKPKFHLFFYQRQAIVKSNCKKNLGKLSKSTFVDLSQEAQQSLMSECYRAFIRLSRRIKFSWRLAAGWQFLLNCLVELLAETHRSVSYRFMFLAVRSLSLCTRNVLVAKSTCPKHVASSSQLSKTTKIKPKIAHRLAEVTKQMYSWSFVFAARFLVQAVGKIGRHLKPLAFPLYSVFATIIKSHLQDLNFLPLCFHCFQLQSDLMDLTEHWVPIGALLLDIGKALIELQRKLESRCEARGGGMKQQNSTRNNKQHQNEYNSSSSSQSMKGQLKGPSDAAALSRNKIQRLPDLDILIRLRDSDLQNRQTVQTSISRWLDFVCSHLGQMARHPSFAEVVVPLLFHLKQFAKCKNETVRKELKLLIANCESSIVEVKHKRLNLNPLDAAVAGRLFVFDGCDLSITKHRVKRLNDRLSVLKLKIQSESTAAGEDDDDDDNDDEFGSSTEN